jgi:hypothetical protein
MKSCEFAGERIPLARLERGDDLLEALPLRGWPPDAGRGGLRLRAAAAHPRWPAPGARPRPGRRPGAVGVTRAAKGRLYQSTGASQASTGLRRGPSSSSKQA